MATDTVKVSLGEIGVHISMRKEVAKLLCAKLENARDHELRKLHDQLRARLQMWKDAENGMAGELELKRHKTEEDLIADAPSQMSMLDAPAPKSTSRRRL